MCSSCLIADGDHALDLAALKARLADASDRQVMPLRVAWRIPGFERERGLKFRHLIFGDPRRPGALRARLILWRDRRRAQILVGEAATRSEEHTSELQSLMRTPFAVSCLNKKKKHTNRTHTI